MIKYFLNFIQISINENNTNSNMKINFKKFTEITIPNCLIILTWQELNNLIFIKGIAD